MSGIVRVLAIPEGEDKDADGREIGDDWLLATMGLEDGVSYYVTTDRVRCSEMPSALGARRFAEMVAILVNAQWEKERQSL